MMSFIAVKGTGNILGRSQVIDFSEDLERGIMTEEEILQNEKESLQLAIRARHLFDRIRELAIQWLNRP